MPLFALALLLVAAVLHTAWNLLLKGAGAERQLLAWLALLLSGLLGLPLLLVAPTPPTFWPYALASALAEALYFALLAAAYQSADFSLVYPVARGAAPALLALWGVLFLGERPSVGGLIGLAVIAVGLMVVAWPARGAAASGRGLALALGVALCISAYSAIDAAAVRQTPAAPYTVLVFGLTALILAPATLRRHGLRGATAAAKSLSWRGPLVGALMLGAYLLALQAYRLAPVSYAGAVREISVVFAALAGWRLFGEALGLRRAAGGLVIFLGVLLIGLLG